MLVHNLLIISTTIKEVMLNSVEILLILVLKVIKKLAALLLVS